MSENTDTATVENPESGESPITEVRNSDSDNNDVVITETGNSADAEPITDDPDVFPREVVEELRRENGKYRQRAQQHARRLHTELVRATGKLADPTDLEFDEAHLDDPDALSAAVDELLTRKPHLASRKPFGDIGQGRRGTTGSPLGLLDLLKQHT